MTLADRIRAARKEVGVTTTQMAKMMDVSRRTWESYERGESDPRGATLERLVSIGVNSVWLLTGMGAVSLAGQARENIPKHRTSANTWLMSRVVDGITHTYKEVGASLPPASLGELAARIHNEIVGLEGGEDVWRGALALALGRLRTELTDAHAVGTGKASAS